MSRKIVAAHEAKVPVVAVVGRREQASRRVTVRERDGSQSVMELSDAVAMLSKRR